MARIQINALNKQFGKDRVIQDVNLVFEDGELVVLVGPSGCGKSTLLRMIAGLESVTSGDILLDDARINDLAPKDRDIAMVFQSYALYPHMDVGRNMGFSMEIRGDKPSAREKEVEAAAQTLGLKKLLARLPRALSGGQRQRVAMGRAIIRDPKAFLFDEPLSNLDAALRVEMRLEIARLHQRLGATMIYVTHDQVEALTLADRIVVLDHGIVQQVGTPMDLYEKPANLFVARFIGSPTMNLVDLTRPHQLELPQSPAAKTATTLGIRPEHLSLTATGAGDGQGVVEVIERLGSDSFIYIDVPETGRLLSRVPGNTALAAGDTVGLRVDQDHIHWFDNAGNAN